ncbi:short-chain dehydrogenase, partial [Bradyrhizobium sp. CNPSo 4026]|nr:short-chain dehydrogenase [Bradyrhizobium cenepequi]
PGMVGTSIVSNSRRVQTGSDRLSNDEIARLRKLGVEVDNMSDQELQDLAAERARQFVENAPTSAAQAAKIILDGVKAGKWRILVGEDAQELDERVRRDPQNAYTPEFYKSFAEKVGWRLE